MSDTRAGLSLARLQHLTQRLRQDYVDPGRLAGCQWLVARHGQVVAQDSLGTLDAARGTPLPDNALWRIYSMTKPITSVALMMLVEEGRIGLSDPVSAYIPSWADQRVWAGGSGDDLRVVPPRSPVTVRQLLNHSAGLTYGTALLAPGEQPHAVDLAYKALDINTGNGDSLQTFVDKLGRAPLRYHPGEAWAYSFATDVCGYLVQVVSGQPFEQFLQQRIFGPLGMTDTTFTVPADQVHRLPTLYRWHAQQHMAVIEDPQSARGSAWVRPCALASGGGGLVSTLADYHRFCELLRRGGELDGVRLLGPRTLALMRANHLRGDADLTQVALDGFSETAQQGVGFGLGFATTLGEGRAGVCGGGDFYWGGLASTVFWVDPVEDLLAIFMTQLVPSRSYNIRGLFKSIVYGAIVD